MGVVSCFPILAVVTDAAAMDVGIRQLWDLDFSSFITISFWLEPKR